MTRGPLNRWGGALAAISAVAACTQVAPPVEPSPSVDSPATYFSTVRELTVEVAYEPGFEPLVGSLTTAVSGAFLRDTPYEELDFWELTRHNLALLFAGRAAPVNVTVPTTLEEMTALPVQDRRSWDTAAIGELARRVRRHESTATHGVLVVLFLNGVYEKNGEERGDVLGVNVARTPFIAIFKDVIRSVLRPPCDLAPCGPEEPNLAEILSEQLVVVHEAAHALGLVNNGIPLASEHHDREHGRHCANPNCVMYFQNEDFKATARRLVSLSLATGRLQWFGPECAEDARLFVPPTGTGSVQP